MTPADLKTETLRRLKVVPGGGDAGAEDTVTIGGYYVRLHSMLLAKSLVTWALSEAVPPACEEPIIAMLAAMACDEFGVPESRAKRLKAEGRLDLAPASIAERQLRKALATGYVPHPVVSEYF